MKINGRKMFVFITQLILGGLNGLGYLAIMLHLNQPPAWQVVIATFAYLLINGTILMSANTLDKWIHGIKEWRNNGTKD